MANSEIKTRKIKEGSVIRIGKNNKPVFNPENVPVSAIESKEELDLDAVRRQKVREFMNMGYRDYEIAKILSRGITINNKKVKLRSHVVTIRTDMDFIRSEMISSDVDFSSKRIDILDKYAFLYREAIKEYLKAETSKAKSTFIATARGVLDKIAEIENINVGRKGGIDIKVFNQQNIIKAVNEVKQLPEGDRDELVSAIDKILENSKRSRIENNEVVVTES